MFQSAKIPRDVRQFIQNCISSVLHVEILLLLAENKETEWDAAEVSAQLRSNPAFVALILEEFHAAGLLRAISAQPGGGTENAARYRYQAASGDIERTVESLARLYRDHRHSLFATIYSTPEPDALEAFSDAFRLNPGKPEEGGE